MTETYVRKSSAVKRVGQGLLKVLSLFVILEPIWMLLPFAGFLYGSVLHIQTLNRNPSTAWLTHFVFPVLTLGWVGPVMVLAGLALFFIGAGQIYWAKFRRSGLVTRGLYRFVRHPQYVNLTLFGVGILLTWGRAVTFLAFFLMMFLYYHLARSEERTCIRLFGEAYERYRERTSFIFPGDKLLRPLGRKLPSVKLPAVVRVAAGGAATLAICLALMWGIDRIKVGMQQVPYLTATVSLGATTKAATLEMTAGRGGGMPFVQAGRIAVVRGPYRNAFATGFAEGVLMRLRESKTLAGFLAFLDEPGEDVVIVFCGPYEKPDQPGKPGMHAGGAPGGRGPAPDPHGPDRVRLILMRCTLSPGASVADALADKSKRQIRRGSVALVNLARPEGEDLVEADGRTRGPGFPGEERWAFFLSQFAQQPPRPVGAAVVPGAADAATLVLVQAPILRTRLDPPFAKEILDRLSESPTFRDRLRKLGAGGRVVPVAFPRPGPNWYSEHHGRPQISLFVILAQLGDGKETADLFHPEDRDLLSAFTVEMDFQIPRPTDSIGQITPIGPWRDLEERWRFFLSGVGSGSAPHHH